MLGQRHPRTSEQPASLACRLRLSAEEEAVLLCIRAERDQPQQERLHHLLADGRFDWFRFWEWSAMQEVQPLVAKALCAAPVASCVPPAAVKQAKEVRLQHLAYNLRLEAELSRIAKALRAGGIPVTPLKGTQLALRLFGALDARQVGDIDILVPEAQIEPARHTLRALGYAPAANASHGLEEHSFHGVPFVRQVPGGAFAVELHWKLSNPRFLTIDYSDLWHRIIGAGGAGELLHHPLPGEETLLFLALHLPKHGTGALRLLADIDRLIRIEGHRLDWLHVLALAERWNVAELLYFALIRAQLLFSTPVPNWTLQRVHPAGWRRILVDLLAGPDALLRPPTDENLRYNRFQMAYCAMLSPASKAFDAYTSYLFPAPDPSQMVPRAVFRSSMRSVERVGHGVAWTALAFASAIGGLDNSQRIGQLLRGAHHVAGAQSPSGTDGTSRLVVQEIP